MPANEPLLPAQAFPQPDEMSRTVLETGDWIASLGLDGFFPGLVQDLAQAQWWQFLLVPLLTAALVGLILPAKAMLSGFAMFTIVAMLSFAVLADWGASWLVALPLSLLCGAAAGYAGVMAVKIGLRLLRGYTASIGFQKGTLLRAASTFSEFVIFAALPVISTVALLGGISALLDLTRMRHVEALTGLGVGYMLYLSYRHRMVDVTARAQLGSGAVTAAKGGEGSFLDIVEDAINPFQS